MKHVIIGTAGHVDHGKTTLIKALTGRDTDTLKDEKERGISINLGFTYFDLPSGKRAGIVDVPGHERFIKNMLAGVSGIDMVLLVIAGDEGVMPQTREHMNILSLLDIKKGIVVVTKKDMVDSEWMDVVVEDIRAFLKGSFMESAEIIPVSSITGDGLERLVGSIDFISEEIDNKDTKGCFRLPIDRVFTISGFGTVVTGTLIGGAVSEGDRVTVYPSGIETKVRNIQVHEQPVKSAFAGQRVAVNLSNIKVDELKRGDVVAEKDCMESSMMLDCRLNYLKDAERPMDNRNRVRVYHGTSEILGRVVILDRENLNPGDTSLVQLRLEKPLSALGGDKYVIRTYSPMVTVGGGTIIDPNPPKRKRFDNAAIEELLTREKGSPEQVIEQIIYKNSSIFPDVDMIAKLSGRKASSIQEIVGGLIADNKVMAFTANEGAFYAHTSYMSSLMEQMTALLKEFHEKNPLKCGMAKEEVKSRIFEGNVRQKVFDDILEQYEDRKVIKVTSKYISLYSFQIYLNTVQDSIKQAMLKAYSNSGIDAPKPDEMISSFGKEIINARMVFELLLDTGELIRINEEMVLSKGVYNQACDALKSFAGKNGEITLAQYRDLLNTSRKYAVSLLEYFDQVRITRRIGDKRTLF
jgi:selenocysteine-specific elongation factor